MMKFVLFHNVRRNRYVYLYWCGKGALMTHTNRKSERMFESRLLGKQKLYLQFFKCDKTANFAFLLSVLIIFISTIYNKLPMK